MNRRSLNGAKIAKFREPVQHWENAPSQKYYLILQFKSVSEFMNIIFAHLFGLSNIFLQDQALTMLTGYFLVGRMDCFKIC